MAAACFPQTQTWVQEEVDTVIGRNRGAFFSLRVTERASESMNFIQVPTFDDYIDLPRVLAFVLESYRWRPIGGSGRLMSSPSLYTCS